MNLASVLDKATKPQWEIYIQRSRRTDLQLRHSAMEATIHHENTGFGVRVIIPRSDGAGVGFASCTSDKELEETAKRAHDLAKMNRSPYFELPEKTKLPPTQTVDQRIWKDENAAARDYAETAQALISEEKEVSLTFGKVRTYAVETQILNSRGVSRNSKGTYVYLEMTFRIGRSSPTEFWPNRYARRISDVAPTRIIPEWLDIARSCLKRCPPKTKETTVIFAPTIVCDTFVPTVGYHAGAEAVKQNLSQFQRGSKVGSELLTIIDDGLYDYGLETNSFDDEGYPQRRTRIVEKGVFQNHLYDQMYAQTMGSKPTGNGIRTKSMAADVDERYQMQPSTSPTNLSVKPGTESVESLIRDVKEGILIHHAAWIDPDPITTRFGSEIRNAQEIMNGELGQGIVGGTLGGSALELLHKITGISNQAEIVSGSSFGCVSPYVRFDDVQISGPT